MIVDASRDFKCMAPSSPLFVYKIRIEAKPETYHPGTKHSIYISVNQLWKPAWQTHAWYIMYANGKQHQMLRILSTCINLSSFNIREESWIHIRTTTTMHAIRPISHTAVPCDQNHSIPQYSIVCTVDGDSVNKFLGSKVNYDVWKVAIPFPTTCMDSPATYVRTWNGVVIWLKTDRYKTILVLISTPSGATWQPFQGLETSGDRQLYFFPIPVSRDNSSLNVLLCPHEHQQHQHSSNCPLWNA